MLAEIIAEYLLHFDALTLFTTASIAINYQGFTSSSVLIPITVIYI